MISFWAAVPEKKKMVVGQEWAEVRGTVVAGAEAGAWMMVRRVGWCRQRRRGGGGEDGETLRHGRPLLL